MISRIRWFPAVALLAGIAMLVAATPARANTFDVTISVGSQTASDTYGGSGTFTGGATGSFISSTLSGNETIGFFGTVGGVAFSITTSATSNSPGTPQLASISISSANINNGNSASTAISITTSSDGYTQPSGPVVLATAADGTLTSGSLSLGSFNGTAGSLTSTNTVPNASGNSVSVSTLTSTSSGSLTSPYTMTATYDATLGAGTQTANLGGTATLTAVPEPSTMAIAGLGALGLIGYGLRRRKALGA